MLQKTADDVFDDIYDKTNPPADCGLCIFITCIAGLLWTLVGL